MNNYELPLNMDFVMMIAAIVISLFVFTLLIRIVRATLSVAIPIAIVLLVLQLVFGIGPEDTLHYVTRFLSSLWYSISGIFRF